ncbi:MAG: excisionase family DNA-binding protein, partial [Elusimicrobia bacterium]|nr:excisionase family DNA-binding protein [Elusimicrobiota bacterium]
MSEEKRAQVYSTFEVARLCGVFHTTVLHWIRKGKLRAYATPGGHHRITRSALVEFMERYEFPVPRGWEPSPTRVLIVDD